jgi:hypothetical protein
VGIVLKRNLAEFTKEEFEELAKEIEKEFRKKVSDYYFHDFKKYSNFEECRKALEFGDPTLRRLKHLGKRFPTLDEYYREHKKIYGEIDELRYDWKTIAKIIEWFTLLRFVFKYTIDEAKETLGDALTISKNLDESIVQCYDEDGYKEDLEYNVDDHIFVDLVFKELRKRGLRVYRRKRRRPRKIIPKEKIRELRSMGYSIREIARILEISKSTVQRVLSKN